MKVYCKKIALSLVITLLTAMIPITVFADNNTDVSKSTAASQNASNSNASTENKPEPKIVGELKDKRTSNQKEFLLDNNTYEAVIYPEAVHYKDSTGAWKDIDNSMTEQTDDSLNSTDDSSNLNSSDSAITTASNSSDASNKTINSSVPVLTVTPAITPTVIPTVTPAITTDLNNPALTDSSLAAKASKSNSKVYTNKNNDFKINIAEKSNSKKLVSIKKDKYEINWGLQDTDNVQSSVLPVDDTKLEQSIESQVDNELAKDKDTKDDKDKTNLTQKRNIKIENEKKKIAQNNSSTVDFKNIFNNIDLQYNTVGNKVKENIVINSPSDKTEFVFNLNVKNLVPELQKDNSIIFYDESSTKTPVFTVNAPYMIDAAKNSSNKIDVSLEKNNKGYTMTLKLDKDWINSSDRKFPIIVDPSVQTSTNINDIKDTFVASIDTENKWQNETLQVGNTPVIGTTRSFIHFEMPSDITAATTVYYAQLNIGLESSTGNSQVDVHKVISTPSTSDNTVFSWSNSNAISYFTWANSLNIFDTKVEDFINLSSSTQQGSWQHFDITSMVKQWTTSGVNNGLMLQNHDESSGSSIFASSDCDDAYAYVRPFITIQYINNSGLESYWTYHSQPIGRGGTGYINDYNGNLIYVHDDLSETGSKMPISIKHVYNSNDRNVDIGYGPGWRLNLSQRLVHMTIGGIEYYEYTDEDGTKHYFNNQNGTWKDEAGLSFTLNFNSDGTYTVTDKKNNKLIFTSGGYLWRLQDSNGNQETLQYSGEALTGVTDGANRTVTLNVSNGYLVGITDAAGRTTSFAYNHVQLSQIKYPDKNTTNNTEINTNFSYDSDNKMLTAKNYDGYTMTYNYYDTAPYRVKSAVESNGSTTAQSLNINYEFNTTTFTDVKGRTNVYQFDEFGKTISIKDNDGSAAYYKYNSAANTNTLASSSKLQKVTNNYLQNHNAEINDTTSWSVYSKGQSTGSGSYTTEDKYIGNQSLKITKTNNYDWHAFTQSLNLTKGKAYTFSAYVKTSNITSSNKGGAAIFISYYDSSGNWQTAQSECVSGSTDWQRLETSFTLPSNATSNLVYARVGIIGETGTAYFDCMQFEDGNIANRYNLVENSDFDYLGTNIPLYWSGSNCTGDDTHALFEGKNTFSFTGSGSVRKDINQTINVSGSKDDVFVLSGWAKGQSVPLDKNGTQRYFALDVGFVDATTGQINQWEAVQFNEDCSDWQYISRELIANYAYKAVIIYGLYYNNANKAYFDSIQLYKEQYGQSYQYDSNGNVTSSQDLAKNKSTFSYDGNNNLISAVDPKGGTFKYEYDNNDTTAKKNNITKATSAENVVYSFTYDSSGNALTSKVGDNTLFMQSSASYTSSGNYMKSMTDSSGNTVVNNYDENKGTLTSAVDAAGSFTNYTYDAADRLTNVSKNVGGSNVENFSLNSNTTGSNGTKPVSEHPVFETDSNNKNYLASYEPTTNLLTNSSFENSTSSWTTNDWSSSTGKWKIVNDGVDGSQSVECYDSDGLTNGSTTNPVIYQNITFPSALTTNTSYTISAYAKRIGVGATQPQIGIDCFDANGSGVPNGYINVPQTINANQWTRISQTFTVPAGTKSFMAILRSAVKDSDVILFDGAQVEAKAYNSAYTLGTSTATNVLYNLGVNKLSGTETLWLNTKGSGARQVLSNEGSNSEILNIYIDTTNTLKVAIRKNDNTWVDLITVSDTPINLNTWYFVALRWQINNGTLNCSLKLNNNVYNASAPDFKDFSGGQTGVGNSKGGLYQLDGDIEQFNYSPKYLSDTDITALSNKTFNNSQGTTVSNSYQYKNDKIDTISENGVNYKFNYDPLGNNTSVAVGNKTLITNNIDPQTGNLLSATYGNGQIVSSSYDSLDRVTSKSYQSSASVTPAVRFTYEYDSAGNLGYVNDIVNNVSYRYIYDCANRLVKIKDSKGNVQSNNYDKNNNVSSVDDIVNGTKYTTNYTFDKDNKPKTVNYTRGSSTTTVTNNYDSIGRLQNSVTAIVNGPTPTGTVQNYTTSYTYQSGMNGSTTSKVQTINNNGSNIDYTYDANGNIKTITQPDGKCINYTYNELNELTREDNQVLNKTIVYTYDGGGNIQNKNEYAYTTGTVGGTPTSPHSYTYGDANWKDKLTAYDGKEIKYDTTGDIGNPISYDGYNYTYEEGRQLSGITGNGITESYKYNDAGIRTQKIYGTQITDYHLSGDKVTYEERRNTAPDIAPLSLKKIYYSYDNAGQLISMNLNGTEYYYIKNAQGDIIGLFDSTGKQVVSYVYDSWGKLISTTGTLASTVGADNPYRYRGYRYDSETGLYYLQSRYYNPEWGRFINADSIGGKVGDLLSHNIFAYCKNNPINMSDPDGHWSWKATLAVAVAVVVVVAVVAIVVATDGAAIGLAIDAISDACYAASAAITCAGVAAESLSEESADVVSDVTDDTTAVTEDVCNESGNCFVAGTKVETKDGEKSIEDIKKGDKVYSENPETGEKGYKKVVQTFVHETDTLMHIYIGDTKIDTTEGHRFWVVDKGWTHAKDLKLGDKLLQSSGKIIKITKLEVEHLKKPVKIYNFEVQDWHTYFVSDAGVLVHNTGCGNQTITTQGKGMAPKKSIDANSIYEKLDNEKPEIIKSRTFYNEDGKPFCRQDFYVGTDPHTHNVDGIDLFDHQHIFMYNSQGQPIGERVIQLFTQGY